jgi:hypothetical protein
MRKNDEARMANDEIMTTSKDRNVHAEDSFWHDGEGVVREEPEIKRVYDLEERTAFFGEAIIDFARKIPQDAVTNLIFSKDLEEQVKAMTDFEYANIRASGGFVIRASLFLRHSSFVIRHFEHAR